MVWSREDGLLSPPIHDDDIVWVKVVEKRARLRADQYLSMMGSLLEQRGDDVEGVRVKAQLRLVDDDQTGKFRLRLEEKRDEADGPQGGIGELVRTEDWSESFSRQLRMISFELGPAGSRANSWKNGAISADRADDSRVCRTPILVLQAVEECGEIARIGQ